MSSYRRLRISGASYFFTVALADRRSTALTDNIDALRAAFRAVLAERPVRIDALVVLPDHLHAVWTLPAGDADFSGRWKRIKTGFTKTTGLAGRPSASKRAKGEKGLWQRRFWEHMIRDGADYRAHIEYCWFNPVRHGLVWRVRNWPHSTFHRDVSRGLVPADWGVGWMPIHRPGSTPAPDP